MLKDWDFAQFFPNWNGGAVEETAEEQRSSTATSTSSSGSPPKQHRRNESDSALARHASGSSQAEAKFGPRLNWRNGRQSDDESPVSLTEFSRKSSQLELRTPAAGSEPAPPRRQKTDILDVRRQQLKRELEERRRTAAASSRGSALVASRPPLMKSSSEPCAPLAFASLRDRPAQVRPRDRAVRHLYVVCSPNKHPPAMRNNRTVAVLRMYRSRAAM